MTLKAQLLAADLDLTEDDFGHHETDLYVLSKPNVVTWLRRNYPRHDNVSEFVGAAGSDWAGQIALDIPFAYEPGED